MWDIMVGSEGKCCVEYLTYHAQLVLASTGPSAGCACAGYLLYKWLSGFSWVRAQLKKRGPSRAPAKEAAPTAGGRNEWLQGTFAPGAKRAKPRSEFKKAS